MNMKTTATSGTSCYRNSIGVYGLLLMMAVAAASAGCSEKKLAAPHSTPAVSVSGIVTETVTSAPLPETFEVIGTVRARTSAVVSARIAGVISILKVRAGDRVRKGQLLAQLDAQENQATAAVAAAGTEEARRGLDEARSRKKLADSTFERYQKLLSEQAISRQEFDVKQTERDLAGQGLARAEARLEQARAGARAAATVADYTRIVAPIAGIITVKPADLGATVFPAQPIMTIEDEGSYQLELAIPESLVTQIKVGSTVQVTLDALGSAFTARISEIVPAAEPASRTFTAKVNLSQPGLKSGMFGRAALLLGTSASGLTLSRTAVVERGALTAVWTVDSLHIAHLRLVKLGKPIGRKVEILAGLSDGERVVVSGVEKMSEAARVE